MGITSQVTNKVIVLGGNHHNGLGIIRSLGEAGINVSYIVFGKEKNYVIKSKYLKKYWYATSEGHFIDILHTHFQKTEEQKGILIPSDDYTAALIDKNINKLKGKYIFPSINEEENAISIHMNKKVMTKLAERHGFLVPKSFEIELKEQKYSPIQLRQHRIAYPCIIKPLESINGSKSDIIICNDDIELIESLKGLKNEYDKIFIQEFIEKKGEVGIQGIALHNGNDIIIPGVIEKIRESTIAPGSTTYARVVKKSPHIDLEEIKTLITNFINELGFKGIFDLELMYTKDRVYFIELNFRNGAYGYAFTKAGINMPKILCLDLINKDISKESIQINQEITLMSEFADIKNIFSKKISLLSWIRQISAVGAYLTFNIKDIKPFIYRLFYR